MRIGLLGGTFNPVHHGHLILAQDALEAFALDRVWFVLSPRPPHKPAAPLAPAADRAAWLEAALADDPRFELCRAELERDGPSYTIDTLRALRAAHPGHTFVFLIGADTLRDLHTWRRIGDLLDLVEFATLARPETPLDGIRPADLRLPPPWPEKLLARCATGHRVQISSSEIRKRLAAGRSVRYLVPPSVEKMLRGWKGYGA